MSHGPTQFISKGACIYCGATATTLTDEHILPLSLGGTHVLVEASCKACAAITSRFEFDVARKLWGDVRIAYNATGRRKKKRPTHIVLNDPKDPGRKVKVPYSEYPAPMIFYRMGPAGLLQGLPETLDQSFSWKIESTFDDEKAKQFEDKFGVPLTAGFWHLPDSVARLLAKIGYGQVLTSLDPEDFRPICLPYILGKKKNLSFIVGGKLTYDEPTKDIGYILSTRAFGTRERIMLVAVIRLYSNNHTPTYHVVVGSVQGADRVEKAVRKMGPVIFDVLPPAGGETELAHWMPRCVPLPFWETEIAQFPPVVDSEGRD